MDTPIITFLSDYGLRDEFVGTCHAVIAGICPAAKVIDLTHGIHRHDLRSGAQILRSALPYLPAGVHLAVVDPDVGAGRRAVALGLADGRLLVGPDNGVLSPAAEAAGGIVEAVDIAQSPVRLEPVSATFHGRDIFAPVAAHLAAGRALVDVGTPCDPAELVALELPHAELQDETLIAHAMHIDRFGNITLDVSHGQLTALGLKLGQPVVIAPEDGHWREAHYARTFADVEPGELMVYEDASRSLAIAVSHGDAAQRLGAVLDTELRLRAA